MQSEQPLQFRPYRLDPRTGQLWRGKQEVKVTRKAAAVLCQLVARAGQMVTKAELFQTVWKETVVSDAALSSCIQELRRVLRDQARSPRYIETGHGRGYRFIGKVASGQSSVVSPPPTPHPRSQLATRNWQLTTRLVGRDAEFTQLHGWLDKALSGQRQIVFVTGEAGIGKTALLEAFAYSLASRVQRPASEEHEESQISKVKSSRTPDPELRTPFSRLPTPDPRSLDFPWAVH